MSEDAKTGSDRNLDAEPTHSTPAPELHDRPSIKASKSSKAASSSTVTARARRLREEQVRRLVADVQSRPYSTIGDNDAAILEESRQWLVASTVATAVERGLDRDLHAELVQEAKDNSGRIGQVCHDHSDVFLSSVGKVVALGAPSSALADRLKDNQHELQKHTAGPMHAAAERWEDSKQAHVRAKTLHILVKAVQKVAMWVERARKQAQLGRPRAALEAVDEARTALTAPMSSLFYGASLEQATFLWKEGSSATRRNSNGSQTDNQKEEEDEEDENNAIMSLEETPFGRRIAAMLPKIENDVLMGARRGLNRWFLSLRSGGDAAKAGRAVLRKCAHSIAMGPGELGLGGRCPSSYVWRAKTADNLIARVDQDGRVARAVRMGYWFERDAPKEAERLENAAPLGMERRAEAFAAAFGWYRCWEEGVSLMVDPSDFLTDDSTSSSRGLSGSRHGLGGSRHGKQKTLSFRASSVQKKSAREISIGPNTARSRKGRKERSPWAELLTPEILYEDSPTRREDDEKLLGLTESLHPVRRAELAFALVGKSAEFTQYYEQNRFGDTKIGNKNDDDDEKDARSALSSLTGDDVSVGTDRVFFAKSLPHLCCSVVGFSAVEAALELGTFTDEEEEERLKASAAEDGESAAAAKTVVTVTASPFRDMSEKYERALVTELGQLLRRRAIGASLPELVRASCLMAAFRSALKIVHPSSTTRRSDKDLLAMDVDIVMTALKVAQDEQMKATAAIAAEDKKEPMIVSLSDSYVTTKSAILGENKSIPDPEEPGLPFGLNKMKQSKPDLHEHEQRARTSYNQKIQDEYYCFSQSVPVVLRSIHARAIACAAFALSQEELGQNFPEKKGSASAGYVLDTVEECINVACVALKDSDNVVDEGSVEKAVQLMANVLAVEHSLARLFGTLMRGMCHVGMIRADEIDATFKYAEKTLKGAEKACEAQVGAMYSTVYEICKNKIDTHMNYALENFNWVAKSVRDMPNAYCEGLIGYMRSVFNALGPMDEGSRTGLQFSCFGRVSERLCRHLSERASAGTVDGPDGIPPISKIDAYGLKNMSLDVLQFRRFADSLGIPQLSECFNELESLIIAMLDKELPALLNAGNANAFKRKYPYISIDKICIILEKYVGTGLSDRLMGGGGGGNKMLIMDKKEVQNLLRAARSLS